MSSVSKVSAHEVGIFYPSLLEAWSVAVEQISYWRLRGVTIVEACTALGRRPLDNWEAMEWILAAEWRDACRILAYRAKPQTRIDRRRRSRSKAGSGEQIAA